MNKLKKIVDALTKGNYTCIAGDLINCVEFIELTDLSNNKDSFCCLGKSHPCPLNVNDGYCAAIACQYKVDAI